MSALVDVDTKVLVQGMGRVGQLHTRLSKEFGTRVVGGVSPGRGGQTIEGVPVFERENYEADVVISTVDFPTAHPNDRLTRPS